VLERFLKIKLLSINFSQYFIALSYENTFFTIHSFIEVKSSLLKIQGGINVFDFRDEIDLRDILASFGYFKFYKVSDLSFIRDEVLVIIEGI
jgi:hypothetical protein